MGIQIHHCLKVSKYPLGSGFLLSCAKKHALSMGSEQWTHVWEPRLGLPFSVVIWAIHFKSQSLCFLICAMGLRPFDYPLGKPHTPTVHRGAVGKVLLDQQALGSLPGRMVVRTALDMGLCRNRHRQGQLSLLEGP